MIKVSESLNGAIENFLEITPDVTEHMANKNNPHAVTKGQIGLSNVENERQATKAEFDVHTANKNNPHAVTKGQIGLSDVLNERQATAAQYAEHIGGNADRHSAEDILYSADKTVKEKLDEVESGRGTIDHKMLINCDAQGAHPISAIEGLEEKLTGLDSVSDTKEDVEKIKSTIERGSIYITGKAYTPNYNVPTKIMFEGDERFVQNGSFTMPRGSAAELYISIILVEKDGDAARHMRLFKYTGRCMKHYNQMWPVLNQIVDEGYFADVIPNNDDVAPPAYNLTYSTDYDGLTFYASGDGGCDIYWKATIEIKNFTEIEA